MSDANGGIIDPNVAVPCELSVIVLTAIPFDAKISFNVNGAVPPDISIVYVTDWPDMRADALGVNTVAVGFALTVNVDEYIEFFVAGVLSESVTSTFAWNVPACDVR